MPASISRRLKRQQERETTKLRAKIQKETLEKLNKMTEEEKLALLNQLKLATRTAEE